MVFISIIKEIAEAVTATSAAIIVLKHASEFIPKPIKEFFKKTIPTFFRGFTNASGEKVRFIKAIKANKEQQEQFRKILQTLAPRFGLRRNSRAE